MNQATPSFFQRMIFCCGGALCLLGVTACKPTQPDPPKETAHWPTLPLAAVPPFMHGTVYERVRVSNIEPYQVGGYSLVVNLHDTGDSTAPTAVRDYIKKQMLVHQFDSLQNPEYANLAPDAILKDKRVAIVMVEGPLPVGARVGQRFDITVKALPHSHTTSLAHGAVYQADLSEHGLADATGTEAHVLAKVDGGEVFVNPAYALTESGKDLKAEASSVRTGIVLNGGFVTQDRPIFLQLREPQFSTSRLIEGIIQYRFQDKTVAQAQDEGLIEAYVPPVYNGDWKHFVGVITHLYLNDSPAFLVPKTRELCQVAHEANAPLADISYCWEGMGEDALPIYEPLITDPNPEIAFAAARAAAFVGDLPAKQALLAMAQDSANPEQLAAVQTLAGLPDSPQTDNMLRHLVDSDSADVRIAAYKILCKSGRGVITKKIGDRFLLDIVESSGKPMIYATRTGAPRIAVFGHNLTLQTPLTFTAMDSRLMIASGNGMNLLTVFYRDPRKVDPTNVLSHNDIPEIIARLGGEGPDADDTFDFSYNDVVAIAQMLSDQKLMYGTTLKGTPLAASFVLERPAEVPGNLPSIPKESPAGRPQGHGENDPPLPDIKAAADAAAGPGARTN